MLHISTYDNKFKIYIVLHTIEWPNLLALEKEHTDLYWSYEIAVIVQNSPKLGPAQKIPEYIQP